MYFVYVLQSKKDHKYYYGFTKSISRRLAEHNAGKVTATKSRLPFDLMYYETVATILEARKKERYFKSGFGRKYIAKKLLALSSNG